MKYPAPLFNQNVLKWTLWLVVGLYSVLVIFSSHLNHDVAWILYSSGEMLKGAEFGKDVIDITPPLIWWLNWPPALAAQLFNLPTAALLRVYILLLIVVSLILTKYRAPEIENWKLAVAAGLLTIMPGYDFGQREHFMVILALPYLAGSSRHGADRCSTLKITCGVLAGIGFCIKPHFIFIPLIVELINTVRSRKLFTVIRCEIMVMVSIGILYVLATVIFAPEYLASVVPQALANYGAYDNPLLLVLKNIANKNFLLLLAIGYFIYDRGRWGIAKGFLWAAIGSVLATLSQSKGWNYHVLPISMLLALALLFVEANWKNKYGFNHGLAVVALLIALSGAKFTKDLYSPNGRHALVSALSERIETLPGNRSVFALITSPRDIWPAIVSANGHWSGSAASAFLLPAGVNQPQNVKAVENADRQMNEIAVRLIREKPALIIINGSKYHLAISKPGFDYITYLKRYDAYAEIFSYYDETTPIGKYRVFAKKP